MILAYPEVRTDLNFISIPTVPLEQRIGIEKLSNENCTIYQNGQNTDEMDTDNPNISVRIRNSYPTHRRFTDSQTLLIESTTKCKISINRISLFGIRPPELFHIFKKIGNFFRWFHMGKKCDATKHDFLSIYEYNSYWINGVGRIYKIRYNALSEVRNFLISKVGEINTESFRILLCITDLYIKISSHNRMQLTETEKKNMATCRNLLDTL